MNNCHYIIMCLVLFLQNALYSQDQQFTVSRVPFSSGLYDEFSPVFYGEGIVFCSNQNDNSLISYNENQNGLFKIFYAKKKGEARWKYPLTFAREITSGYNDGPVTFNESGDLMYFSRNNAIEKHLRNISDTSNKLGIYSAELIDGVWSNVKPFPYNNPSYSLSTPALAPGGKRLYFSSDMPGGSGGMDLYYCEWRNNAWDPPVNLGPVINTPDNESFPYAGQYGKLYFASDGHNGFGGKDLFYTQEIYGEWIVPVHLDSPINSEADDFGIVTDSTFENGYFSTNRRKTDDIYSFTSAPVDFDQCNIIGENNFCFTFYDEQYELIDTIPVIYQWDFGDGIIRYGKEVKHCFPGPGKYLVKLSIFDELTGEAIADRVGYRVELEDIEQAYIDSYNVGITGEPIVFDAAKTYLKNLVITDFHWDFGEGFKPGGPLMTKVFKKQGEYVVKLGLLTEDSTGRISKTCVMKKINVYNAFQELELTNDEGYLDDIGNSDGDKGPGVSMQVMVYLINDLSERQKTTIREILNEPGKKVIQFDRYGIKAVSYPFLDAVIEMLKEHSDIRLELALHTMENDTVKNDSQKPDDLAQKLAYYFKNHEAEINAFSSKGFDLSHPLLKPVNQYNKKAGGIVELIFRKNEN